MRQVDAVVGEPAAVDRDGPPGVAQLVVLGLDVLVEGHHHRVNLDVGVRVAVPVDDDVTVGVARRDQAQGRQPAPASDLAAITGYGIILACDI